jgi:antitoxin component of RelBE/YafQ-DinJ toxin-antitoxin module
MSKRKMLSFRATNEAKAKAEQQAAAMGMTFSQYMRHLINKHKKT